MQFIRVTSEARQQIVECLRGGQKIAAIKILKEEARRIQGTAGEPRWSLREAKLAVERFAVERGLAKPGSTVDPEAVRIVTGPQVKQIVFNFGADDITVDLEGMQMTALTEMQNIGLDACKEILDVVDIFRAIEDGKEIKIVDPFPVNDPDLEEFGRGIADA